MNTSSHNQRPQLEALWGIRLAFSHTRPRATQTERWAKPHAYHRFKDMKKHGWLFSFLILCVAGASFAGMPLEDGWWLKQPP